MNKFLFILFILILILADMLLFRESSDIRILLIILIYEVFVKVLKLKSNVTFIFALIFLLMGYFQFIFSDTAYFVNPGPNIPFSEKSAVWTFLFMGIGIIQKWREQD